jgi:methyl-accepting chemotaxis protein
VPDTVEEPSSKLKKPQHKLAAKLLAYVLFFSFFVTLVTSGYIIYSDYRQGTNTLNQSIHQIQVGYQESISYSLWNFDSQQINTQLAGIINFPGVLNVYIETKEGLLHSMGDFEQESEEKHAFDLFFISAERQYPLGVLNITLDYQGLYKTLFYKTLNILASQFIKTFSVSLFILFIFQRLVTHRLLLMSKWADNFSLNNLDNELKLNSNDKHDEIDAVVDAINSMRNSLKEDISKRELTEHTLNQTQYKLSIAINNAELGFCEYSQKSDRFDGNNHFANHLNIDHDFLNSIEHPVDWFKSLICGEHCIEQRERINQLLHGHMERICTELSLKCSDQIKHFDSTIQVSKWDENGLPFEIVFCILDKTEQVNASKQASELNYALEQKVAQRTEQLSNEQIQSLAQIKQLEHKLESFEQYESRQKSQENLKPLHYALQELQLSLSKSESIPADRAQQLELVKLLSDHLKQSNQLDCETFDVVTLVQELTANFTKHQQPNQAFQLKLPFSLMLDSYKHILSYCLERSLLAFSDLHQQHNAESPINITLLLEGDFATISLHSGISLPQGIKQQWEKPEENTLIIVKMCHAVIQELLDGNIRLIQSDSGAITLSLRFSINSCDL